MKGSTATVFDDVLNSSVKIKRFYSDMTKEVMDREVEMLRRVRPNICAPIVSYKYPHLRLQKMDESLTGFVMRKQPTLDVISRIIDDVSKFLIVMYADGMFHCDCTTNNVMLKYRTQQSEPLVFSIDVGISKFRNEYIVGLPRVPDSRDKEYDFMFFLYSCLHCCEYMLDELYEYISPFIEKMKYYFEKYHTNGRNHEWYRVGTLYKRFLWKISLEES